MRTQKAIARISLALTLALAWSAAGAEECTATPVEGKDGEYAVHDQSDTYKGYVAIEPDGSWFIWVKGKGAANRTYASREEAVRAVCDSN